MAMTQNLLDQVASYFKRETVRLASVTAGENEGGVQKALGSAIPLVLSSFIDLTQRPGGTEVLWSMTREANESRILANLSTSVSTNRTRLEQGTELMRSLLDERYNSTVEAIARAAGITSGAVGNLLGITAPITLGVLGSCIIENKLTSAGLGRWLQSEKNNVFRGLTPEIGGAAPWEPTQSASERLASGHTRRSGGQFPKTFLRSISAVRWTWLALAVTAVMGLAFYLGNRYIKVLDNQGVVTVAALSKVSENRVAGGPRARFTSASSRATRPMQPLGYRRQKTAGSPLKVVAPKAFFYDEPKPMPSNGRYLVKGDIIYAQAEVNNYVKTYFVNPDGKSTAGWLKVRDVHKIEEDTYKTASIKSPEYPQPEQPKKPAKPAKPSVAYHPVSVLAAPAQASSPVTPLVQTAAVQADTAYFFTSSDLGQQRRAFCVKGDRVTLTSSAGEAVFATFVNWEKQKTSGWMKKEALGDYQLRKKKNTEAPE